MTAQNVPSYLDLAVFNVPGAKPAPGTIRLLTLDGESFEFIDSEGNTLSSGGTVASVFGRTGAVTANSGDYTVAKVTGAAPLASPTFTGVPAGPTAAEGTSTTQLATTAFVQRIAAPFSIGVFLPGVGSDAQVALLLTLAVAVKFLATAALSSAVAKVAATWDTTYTFSKNGTPFATVLFGASDTAGVWTQAADATFAVGDVLEIDGPATADASLADIAFTFVGAKT